MISGNSPCLCVQTESGTVEDDQMRDELDE